MTIKQQGGIFGRNPTFNDVEVEGTLTTSGALNQSGDFSVDTDTFVVDTTNNRVGIGTASPQTDVFVVGQTSNSGKATIVLENPQSTSSTGLSMGEIQWKTKDASAPGVAGFIDVQDYNNFGTAFKMILGGGLVGSGVTGLELDASGNATIPTGNLVIGTSGQGIDFSATSGTGTSELFDDYEEGTWTPTLTTDATDFTSVTYDGLTSGVYTKIGNVVQISGTLRTDAITVGSASGTVLISGLPFTAAAPTAVAIGSSSSWNTDHPSSGEVRSGTTALALLYRATANGAATNVAPADCRTSGDSNLLRFTAVYRT